MNDTLLELLKEQLASHPAMQLQDCVKLLYQRILGSEHMSMPPERCYEMLLKEKESIGTNDCFPAYEKIGENSCRFHLLPIPGDEDTLRTLSNLFLKSMKTLSENASEKKPVFEKSLDLLLHWIQEGLLPFNFPEAKEYLSGYRLAGYPAVHHSNVYRDTYHPAYRLLRTDYAHYFSLFVEIDNLLKKKRHVVIAIDGKCGSGKSTLATLLTGIYSCNVIHMDDFYLPMELRTKERLTEVGGNIHYERFSSEVLPTLKKLRSQTDTPSKPFTPAAYRIFDCHLMDYKNDPAAIEDKPLTVVEGSYSLRSEFRDSYDLKIFLDIPAELQKIRLLSRNGKEAYKNFESKWIPMENKYFEHYRVSDCCDYKFTS